MQKILKDLAKIQEKLKVPKNQWNQFGKFHYRSCEDILEAVKPVIREIGGDDLVLFLTDEVVQVGERNYVKATAILMRENERIENTAYAREEETKKGMDGSQITGASSSYARKYALNGLFAIDDLKDSDSKKITKSGGTTPKVAPKATPKVAPKAAPSQVTTPADATCSDCGAGINDKVKTYSERAFGRPLCYKCQTSKQTAKK